MTSDRDFYTPEQRSAYNRAYFAANQGGILSAKQAAYRQSRFFWRRSLKTDAAASELWCLWHKQRGCCALTGVRLERKTAHLDHRIPRSKGGSSAIDNLQWVHRRANYAKHNDSDEEVTRFLADAAEIALRKRYGTHYIIPFIRRFS